MVNAGGAVVAAGIIAASIWLLAREKRAEAEIGSALASLNSDTFDLERKALSEAMAELVDAQKRSELPLTIDAPGELEKLTKRLHHLSAELDADFGEIAAVVAGAENATVQPEPEPPSASFSSFRYVQHQIVFLGATVRGSTPVYSFRREFEGSIFPPDNYTDIRKGQIFCGWKIASSETPKIRGQIVEVKVGERKSGPIFAKRQLPAFNIHRLLLVESGTGRKATVTAPFSEVDREAAEQSRHGFEDSWAGQTPAGEITLSGPRGTEILTVRAGDEFAFGEQTYRVLSVQPGKMELLETPADRKVIWGRE